jgi:SAM-dependent methyltransferase
MALPTQNWYASWFDTPYYHILYKDRGYDEAQAFMRALMTFLKPKNDAKILDLACGKGRHSVYLNSLGYNVTGVDLSKNSINYAQQFENDTLNFKVHDMCKPTLQKFDVVLNLFTSFGYFEDDEDNLRTIKAIKQDLKNDGIAVIDFMNVDYVISHLVPTEVKTMKGIDFHINRYVKDNHIYKDIDFEDDGEQFKFTEKVKAITLEDFKNYFKNAGLTLVNTFGDYQLNEFDRETSKHLILVFK